MRHSVLLAAAVAALACLAACGSTPPTQKEASGSSATADTPLIARGEAGRATAIEVTITDVTARLQLGAAPATLKAEAGETYVIVSYTLKNTGTAPLPLMERPSLSLVDGKGQTYSPDQMASMMAAVALDDPSGMAADLNPNVSAKNKAAWKVDKAAFDKATWRLVLASDPQLTFSLK